MISYKNPKRGAEGNRVALPELEEGCGSLSRGPVTELDHHHYFRIPTAFPLLHSHPISSNCSFLTTGVTDLRKEMVKSKPEGRRRFEFVVNDATRIILSQSEGVIQYSFVHSLLINNYTGLPKRMYSLTRKFIGMEENPWNEVFLWIAKPMRDALTKRKWT